MKRLIAKFDPSFPSVQRWVDGGTAILLLGMLALLTWQASYFPEINPDESAALLGLQLLKGEFSFPIDPSGPGNIRYYFFDCYPPAYYILNALIFKFAGFGIVQARSATILLMVMAAGLSYWVARKSAGVTAGLLTLAIYVHVVPTRVYSWIVNRPDIAAHVFGLAALTIMLPPLLARDARGGIGRGLAVGLLYSVAVQSHYIALLTGPAVGVIVLWRSRWKPWGSAFAWGSLTGLLGGWTPFIHAAWPYRDSIIQGLMGYGSTVPLTDRFLGQIQVLAVNFEAVAFGLIPLTVVLVVGGMALPRIRTLSGGGPFCWAAVSLAVFVCVGLYPNNTLIWYYGLTYIFAGIIAAGLLLGAVLPARGPAAAVVLILILGLTLEKAAYLAYRADQRVRSAAGVKAATAFSALDIPGDTGQAMALAPIHFSFSSLRDRLLNPWSVVNQSGEFNIRPDLVRAVPALPSLSSFEAALLDHGRNTYDANGLLAQAKAWREGKSAHPYESMSGASLWVSGRFGLRMLMADPGHGSGNWSLWSGHPEQGEFRWPTMKMAGPEGVRALTPGRSCGIRSVMLKAEAGPLMLWRLRYELSLPPEGGAFAIHVALSHASSQLGRPPLGLLVYSPTRTLADVAWNSLRDRGLYPFLSGDPRNRVALIAPSGRPESEATGILLHQPSTATGETAVVDIIAIEPAELMAMEVVRLGAEGQAPDCETGMIIKDPGN